MSTLQQLVKDWERLNNLLDEVNCSATNYKIASEALELAQKYMEKCENYRQELKQMESEDKE